MDNPFEAYIETVQELVALDGKSELASYVSESNVEAHWVSLAAMVRCPKSLWNTIKRRKKKP